MATANYGVFYTQAGGGGVLPTDLAYVDRAQTFEEIQTFTEQAVFENGAVADGAPFYCAINVTSDLTGNALPNKAYVDTIVADAVGVRTDTANTWTAPQTFANEVDVNGDFNYAGPDAMNIGSAGIESSGRITTLSGLVSISSTENSIMGGNGQIAISEDPEQYQVNNMGDGYNVSPTYGTPNMIYTRSGSSIGITVGINLPSPTGIQGKRLTFVAVKDPLQLNGIIKNFNNVAYSNVVVGLCATITLCSLNVNGDCWYVLSDNGTITYNV